MQKFGYLPDARDPRDLTVEETLLGADPYPDENDALARGFDRLLIQNAQSCVGFSIAEALYAAWRFQGIEEPELASPLFIWWVSRKVHAVNALDSGTYIRTAIKQLVNVGFCPEKVWPSLDGKDLELFDMQPSRLAFRAAYDQRLSTLEYFRVTGTGDELVRSWQAALNHGCPIVFGMPVHENYLELKEHVYNTPKGALLGGHAQCALGYDKLGPYGPGTWGPEFGRHGWWHLSWEFVAKYASDMWALRVPPYFSTEVTS